jgi:hypothetical protein
MIYSATIIVTRNYTNIPELLVVESDKPLTDERIRKYLKRYHGIEGENDSFYIVPKKELKLRWLS